MDLARGIQFELPSKDPYKLKSPNIEDPSQNGQGKAIASLFNYKVS